MAGKESVTKLANNEEKKKAYFSIKIALFIKVLLSLHPK